jgi:hypothetical protein
VYGGRAVLRYILRYKAWDKWCFGRGKVTEMKLNVKLVGPGRESLRDRH